MHIKSGNKFEVISEYTPAGDQPKAIAQILEGLQKNYRFQTLLGVTGSGKTFTMANVIEKYNRPTLVMTHNKTLAGQICKELRGFLPNNAVEYFVSYYDYYQPEAYIPRTDTYIAKSSSINDDIDKMRHSATQSLFERNDVVIVASVSCIYGLGMPDEYLKASIPVSLGDTISITNLSRALTKIQYERNDIDMQRGKYRIKGDVLEVFPAYSNFILRIEFFGDEIDSIREIDPVTGATTTTKSTVRIYPAKHFITPEHMKATAIEQIKEDLDKRVAELKAQDKLVEAQRLWQRTKYDLEMISEIGYCQGIENYSRYFDGREPGSPPSTLFDYFPKDFLLIIDESHVSIPQIMGMYNGDQARKQVLVDYGFRLPAAKDNRPLKFDEFWERVDKAVFTTATPAKFELENSSAVIEQVIRPTGLIDPIIEVKPTANQVFDLLDQIKSVREKGNRVIVTTLTKRMAEDLTKFLEQNSIKVNYIHSDVHTIDRLEILSGLRRGDFDVIVGVNLLREGIDLPEVSLVAILDADKEGYLRSFSALVQIIGRAARNVDGRVIMYADKMTGSMERAISETNRRRELQINYNKLHNITPTTIKKEIGDSILEQVASLHILQNDDKDDKINTNNIALIEKAMARAAKELDFETAALLRDKLMELREKQVKEQGSKKNGKPRSANR
jgi:excinuclease ABC subunit B